MDPDNINKALMLLPGLALNETIGQRLVLSISPFQFSDLDNVKELKNIITPENAKVFYHIIQTARDTDFGKRFYRPLMRIVLEQWSTNNQYQDQRDIANRYRNVLLNHQTDPFVTMMDFLSEIPNAFGGEPPPWKRKSLLDALKMVLLPSTKQLLGLLGVGTVPEFTTTVGEMFKRTAWAGFETGFYLTFFVLILAHWCDNQFSYSDEPVAGALWAMLFLSGSMAGELIKKQGDEPPALKELSQVVVFIILAQMAISYFGPFVEHTLDMSAPVAKGWIMPFGYLVTKVLQSFPKKYRVEPGFMVEMFSFVMVMGTRSPEAQLIMGKFIGLVAGAYIATGSMSSFWGFFMSYWRQPPQQYVDGEMGFLKQIFLLPDYPDHELNQPRTLMVNIKATRKPLRKLLSLLLLLKASQILTQGGVFTPNAGCTPPVVVEIVRILDASPVDVEEPQFEYLQKLWNNVKHLGGDAQGRLTPDVLIKDMVANPYCGRVLHTLQSKRPRTWAQLLALGGKNVGNDKRPQVLELYATIAQMQTRKLRDRDAERYLQDAKEQLQRMIDDIELSFVLSQKALTQTSGPNPVLISALFIYVIGTIVGFAVQTKFHISFVNVERMGLLKDRSKELIKHCDDLGGPFEECLLTDTGKSMLENFKNGATFNASVYEHGVVRRTASAKDKEAMRILQLLKLTEPIVAQRLALISYMATVAAPEFWYQNSDLMARVNRRELDLNFTSLNDEGTFDSVYGQINRFINLFWELGKSHIRGQVLEKAPETVPVFFKYGFVPDLREWDQLLSTLIALAGSGTLAVIFKTVAVKPLLRLLEKISPSRIWSYTWRKYRKFLDMLQWAVLPALMSEREGLQDNVRALNDKKRIKQKELRFAVALVEAVLMQEIGVSTIPPFQVFSLDQGIPYTTICLAILLVFWENLVETGKEYFKMYPDLSITNFLPSVSQNENKSSIAVTNPNKNDIMHKVVNLETGEETQINISKTNENGS
jgi:hypothetical protein